MSYVIDRLKPRRFLSVLVTIALAGAAATPAHVYAQYPKHWNIQLEGYAGWLLPSGDVAQLADGSGGVQVSSTLALGARVLLPLVDQPKNILGRISIGAYGLAAPSSDMTTTALFAGQKRARYLRELEAT